MRAGRATGFTNVFHPELIHEPMFETCELKLPGSTYGVTARVEVSDAVVLEETPWVPVASSSLSTAGIKEVLLSASPGDLAGKSAVVSG